jgi:3-dehydroquinate synthase
MTLPAASDAPPRLDVSSSGGSYPVHIGAGLLRTIGALVDATLGAGRRRIVVSNPLVWRLHGDRHAGLSADPAILLSDGERFKTTQTVGRMYDALVRARADRATVIVALGGGVLGDTAGFGAATFLRGLPLVHVPTTLLAQVDSAIGGKVGVNHAAGKNLIGAFHPPRLVVADPDVLRTLPRREFRAGLYEVVKYGIIASRPLFDRVSASLKPLFDRDGAALLPVVTESAAIKARIVGEDERESGPRRALNFGHTVGHALEAVTRYRRFRHGEAVAYGMLAAAAIGASRGTMPEADRAALRELIRMMGPLPAVGDLRPADVRDAIRRDKKVVDGRLHFVLPGPIGTHQIVDNVTEAELAAAVSEIGLA